MGDKFKALSEKYQTFIAQQHLFFVATADVDGYVNVSPKGMDSLRVINDKRVVWLNLTGSGNETAAHVLANGRMTVMFCSFDKQPVIMRLYGTATTIYPEDPQWPMLIDLFPDHPGARQLFDLSIDMVQTSCGFGVPFYEWKGERQTLNNWANKRGPKGIEQYWQESNALSLNGKDTGML